MNALRLSAIGVILSSVLAVVWSMGAGGCTNIYEWQCAAPDGTYLGTNNSTDPNACPCLPGCCIGGPANGKPYPQPGMDPQGNCSPSDAGDAGIVCGPGTVLMGNECVPASDAGDAGEDAEAGPLPSCNGECWPIPPVPNWTGPILLGSGADGGPPECPEAAAPAPVYGGYWNGVFAFACTSNASGTCADLADICGPEGASGFSTCVLQAGDVVCPLVGPYGDRRLLYEATAPQFQPSTFCCLDAPDAGPAAM